MAVEERAVTAEVTAISIIDTIDTNVVSRTMAKIANFQAIIQKTLKPGHDYGVIPGCDKPTLLKPGAEKINMLMGVTSEYEIMDKVEDYEKGFFAYNVKCILRKHGLVICEGVGNCNSKESKYATQNPFSIANTILKMAKKRAYVDATLSLASLSDIFTQDLEDMPEMAIQSGPSNRDNQGKEPGDVVLTFGKFKGVSIKELYAKDKGYFSWLLKNNDKMKDICQAYLDSLKNQQQEQQQAQQQVQQEQQPANGNGVPEREPGMDDEIPMPEPPLF